MNLIELLTELSDRLDLGPVELSDTQIAEIVIDDDLLIEISPGPVDNSIMLNAAVAQYDPDIGASVLEALLEANTLGIGTGGSALGLDVQHGEVTLTRVMTHGDMPFETFDAELSIFVEALKHWQHQYASGDLEMPAAPAPTLETDDKPPHGGISV